MRSMRALPNACGVLGFCLLGAASARADVDVRISPNTLVDFDEPFSVYLEIGTAGDSFNAYEATITFPADLVHYVPAQPASANEGTLMTDVCGNTFLSFVADTDSAGTDTLRITHSLLCAGESVTGPGALYRLDFRSRGTEGNGDVRIENARFANGGVEILPVNTQGAAVAVVHVVGVPGASETGILPPTHPNPFRVSTRVELVAEHDGLLVVDVFSVTGRRVRRLATRDVAAGQQVSLDWDGTDDAGSNVEPGTYFLRVTDPVGTRSQRMVRIR